MLEMKENTDLVQIRPAFGGNIMAQIVTPNTRPQFCTVRYKVFSEPKPAEEEARIAVGLVGHGSECFGFDDFVDFLCNHSDVNIDIKEKIRLYTQLIIAEFVIKGYDLKDIHSLAYNTNVIRVQGGEIIAAPDKYFEISRSQYSSDQEYYTAVTARINQRSIKEILFFIKK